MFGTTRTGEVVQAVTLAGYGLRATILTRGAILQDLRLDGVPHSLTLGSDRLADYEGAMQYHGSIIGPVANRISGARAVVAGVLHQFDTNFEGSHTLHSGSAGVHAKIWRLDDIAGSSVTLSHHLPDGEAGFPGNRMMTARFELQPAATLRLTITTTTDAPTIANATNHSYWNLDGTDHMRAHSLRIAADTYLPVNAHAIPTGEIARVSGTDYDFRTAKPPIPGSPPLDNTFCVAPRRGPVAPSLWLRGASGVQMQVATSEPGMHVYDARAAFRPRDGQTNGPFYEGIAIEAQGFPDAPANPHFPPIALTPDQPLVQITEWQFRLT